MDVRRSRAYSAGSRLAGVLAAPQAVQASASFAPHSPQNFRSTSFCVPQLGHVICGA